MTSGWTDAVERDDGMDDENYHTREVYAHFGLAVYQAQVLEHGVVNLLTLAKIFPDPAATRKMFVPVMEQHFAQVFGQLVKKVAPYLGDDIELLADLKSAVAVRNHLTHRYWREKVGLTLTARGKNRMITELRDIIQMFVDVDERLSPCHADVCSCPRCDNGGHREVSRRTATGGGSPRWLPARGSPRSCRG